MKKLLSINILVLLIFLSAGINAQTKHIALPGTLPNPSPEQIYLNGECAFAADYSDVGERYNWFDPTYNDDMWDRVKIPHVWSMDPRYPYYIGAAWYRKSFTIPDELKNKHIRLVFVAVYLKAKVWLNGKLIAEHYGGYTPFEIDVVPYLNYGKPNLLVVRADNGPVKLGGGPQPQLGKAWMEDGGIIRDVYLEATPDVYISNQKIEAEPNLKTGDANIHVFSWIRNTRKESVKVKLSGIFMKEKEQLKGFNPEVRVEVPANSIKRVEMNVKFPKEIVYLWNLDTPVLYSLTSSIDGIETTKPVNFGIRKFEVRGTELLLNGSPVRLAGANRIASGSEFGQNDPKEYVELDLKLMKEAGLEFMRMHHVPLSWAVLDWADRCGMLLIEECPTDGPVLDTVPKNRHPQYRDMIVRDWNHPSVIAWSVGNEFASETPEGIKFVKDMKELVLSVDSTRLICFASNRVAKPNLKPEEEASYLTDFVCLNTYGATPDDNAANIDRAHQLYPNKPMIITEYGLRADRVGQEQDRELWFTEMIKIFRERPFISGASLWSFNDYRSRYVSTNPDGFRWWGLVDAKRNLRGSYELFRREFTPIVVKEARMIDRTVVIKLAGRADFPVYPSASYQLQLEFYNFRGRQIDIQSQTIVPIAPGKERVLNIPMKGGTSYFRGEIHRGEFSMLIFGPTTWSNKK